MSALDNAVSLGLVKVAQTGGGYVVRGAETDMLIIDELEQMGAVWRDGDRAYFVATSNGAGRMESLRRNTNAAAATLAARQALASEQGVKLFDNERARQQRKVTKEIAGVYDQALKEHEAGINRISELLQQDRPHDVDPKEWAAIVARRKNTLAELESVYDGLSEGLANAGASAQRLMNGQLMESAAISRNVAAWQLDNMSGVNVSRFLAHDQAALALTGVTSFHGKYDLKAWQGVADKRKARATIKNAVARGLLTGEHPDKIARRIQGIYSGTEAGSPHKRAVRIARTETARVMSEATQETLRAANEKGVKVRNRWDATLDGKTRDSHRKVDGEIREVGEKFSNGLRRVGDGGAADSINCRCCMTPVLDGFEPDSPVRRNNETGELMPYMTYEEWEKSRGTIVVPKMPKVVKPKTAKPKTKTFEKATEPVHVEVVTLSVDSMPDEFQRGVARDRTQKLFDFVNDIQEKAAAAAKAGEAVTPPNAKVLKLYSNFAAIRAIRGKFVKIEPKYGAKGHAVTPWVSRSTNKPTKYEIKNPKLEGDNITGQVQTSLHELGHLIDGFFFDNAGEWRSSNKLNSMVKAGGSAFVGSVDDVSDGVRVAFAEAKAAYSRGEQLADEWRRDELRKIDEKYSDVANAATIGADNYKRWTTYRNKRNAVAKSFNNQRDYFIRNEMQGLNNFTDIYDALSGGAFRDSGVVQYGHGGKYFRSVSSRSHEIWANYCALSATRPDLIEVLREDKPELAQMLDEMTDEMLKEAGVM